MSLASSGWNLETSNSEQYFCRIVGFSLTLTFKQKDFQQEEACLTWWSKYSFGKTFHGPELAQNNWSDFILLSILTSFKPPCFYGAINVECSRRLRSEKKFQNLEVNKSALLLLKSHNFSETCFNKVKFSRNFRSCSKNCIKKKDGRFVAMVRKDLQTLNLKFD